MSIEELTDVDILKKYCSYPAKVFYLTLLSPSTLKFLEDLCKFINNSHDNFNEETNFTSERIYESLFLPIPKPRLTLFFDNDRRNLTNTIDCKLVLPIKVDDLGNLYSMGDEVSLANYLQTLPLKAAKFGFVESRIYGKTGYDRKSGLKEEDIVKAKNGINNDFIKNIIFDWDRTLSICEGILTKFGNNINDINHYIEINYRERLDITFQDMAIFYFGGSV
jgi:hypothetical protein